MFVGGNGFKVQKVEAKGKKCLQNWEKLEDYGVKLGDNGNLGWYGKKKGVHSKEL